MHRRDAHRGSASGGAPQRVPVPVPVPGPVPGPARAAALATLLAAFAALLFVATWPGAAIRAWSTAPVELVVPAVPKEITGREGILDVVVSYAAPASASSSSSSGGATPPPDEDEDAGAPAALLPPLAGARVRAYAVLDGRAYAAGEAVSDATGRATLRDLPQAEHWVVAEAAGRARASRMVVVVAGPRRLDLALGPEHTLDVEVKDEQGAALAGAEIEVRASDPFPVGARTDEGGRARVGRLGEGPFTVVARAPGFEEVTRRRAPEGEVVVITLGKQGGLAVEVVGEDGAPAPGARVLVASPTLGTTRVAESDKEGKVRITGLDRGSYALRATSGARASPIELGVVLGKGEERAIRLVLGPGLLVTAHVVDAATEDDVKDARVTLAESGLSPFPVEGVTNGRGLVVLGPIARGPATLSARADGYVPRPVIGVGDDAKGEVKIALARGGVVVGKITDARGYAVDGATLRVVGTDLEGMPIDEDPSRITFREAHFSAQLAGPSPLVPAGELGVMPGPVPAIPRGPSFSPFGGTSASLPGAGSFTSSVHALEPWVTSRDGTFRATPVTPGRVRLIVHHPQYVEALSEVVLVESSKEARVDVVLQRGGELEGRVVDSRRRGVGGAHVTALATRGSLERLSRTGSDGSFAFAALPDAVTLLVARDEDVTTVVARVEVVVPEAGKKSIEIVLPEPRPALPVRVVDARGTGVEAAQVTAVSLDPTQALRVTGFTDGRGQVELAGARGIAARIEVHAPTKAAAVVTTTAETPELRVTLAAAESVTGQVTTRRRDGLAGAEVTLQTEAGVRRGRTSADGTFTIGDLAAGPARIRVRLAGRAPEERAITIEERGGRKPTEVARFELVEEGVVEGVVVDGRGDPIPGARVAKDAVPTYLPVGATVTGMAVADGRGRFRLGELAEGVIVLEAYAADVGRARKTDVRVLAGRTTDRVKIVIERGEGASKEPVATGGVAVTLGETVDTAEVVVVAVSEGSEAERSGLAAYDIVLEVGGVRVASIADARARLSGPVHDDVLVKVRRGERVVTLRVAREAVRR